MGEFDEGESEKTHLSPVPTKPLELCLFMNSPTLRIGVTLIFHKNRVVFHQALLDAKAGPKFIREGALRSKWRE